MRENEGEGTSGGSGGGRVYRQPLPQQTMKIIDLRGPVSSQHEKRKSKKDKSKKRKKDDKKDERSTDESSESENDSLSSASSERKLKKKKKEKKSSKKKKDKERAKDKSKSSHKWNPFLHLFALRISDTTREFRVSRPEER
jgi:hypothetical protein